MHDFQVQRCRVKFQPEWIKNTIWTCAVRVVYGQLAVGKKLRVCSSDYQTRYRGLNKLFFSRQTTNRNVSQQSGKHDDETSTCPETSSINNSEVNRFNVQIILMWITIHHCNRLSQICYALVYVSIAWEIMSVIQIIYCKKITEMWRSKWQKYVDLDFVTIISVR